MKHAVLILALALAPLPALAQESPAPEAEEGPSLMERGLALFFEGFRQELEPALEGMGDALTELQPALDSMMGMIDDMTNYSMPEMLENGDIIMRRKPDAPPVEPPAAPGTDL
ncbi:MAG: AAA+ family ATPase [Fuscovulum sp.]|jgi:hypothetical protein|nr:MAG: AAA+ family ATPase [Fuscovulum sp.]